MQFCQIQNLDYGIKASPLIKALLAEFTGHCSSAHLSPLAGCRESYICIVAVLEAAPHPPIKSVHDKAFTFSTSQLSHIY